MRAITVLMPGGPEQLIVAELPAPQPGPGEILIRVHSAGLNRADLLQRQGHYPPPPGASPLLGLEVSGEVAAVGPDPQEHWRVGDRVCALLPGGGYAEYAVASEGCCLPVPEGMPLSDAAALPEAVFTVWANLFSTAPGQATAARVERGERLLVQGGSSGIGSVALQLARARGVLAAATAGSAEKCQACLGLGAVFAVDYHEDWAEAIRAWAPDGVDVILDMVAGPYFRKHLALLGTGGRLAHIATAQGSEVQLDIRELMHKRLVITASMLRARSPALKRGLRDEILREVWPLLETGALAPVIQARFPAQEAAAAHREMEKGAHTGKLLLEF
ncbi:NAD(P)H-quinone oxidoreductase [Acidipila sp. EB88]|uniref:NAD(P)H-quinone oxidoreductase n=1 Tax=Acidipila sp. EB88 TaxID=2305226 RepID=UPI000F5E4220|nr:NAD(P)H-quinone oxidoreductase [Acidipila sp. EB88]RRA47312.1 NAD(P)H-quinone oxidoreductase [Acidipila sp. EB88]